MREQGPGRGHHEEVNPEDEIHENEGGDVHNSAHDNMSRQLIFDACLQLFLRVLF